MTAKRVGLRIAVAITAAAWFAAGLAAAGAVAISDVKVEVKTGTVGASKGKDYLRVTYAAQVSEPVEKLSTVQVKASCKAGDKTLADQFSLGPKLDVVEKGGSKPGTAPLFMKEGLPVKPSQCTLNFALGKPTARGEGTPLKEYCWDGSSVKEGACK